MTLQAAMRAARDLARRKGREVYVVLEDGLYDLASAFDMDTFYADLEAVAVVEPDTYLVAE